MATITHTDYVFQQGTGGVVNLVPGVWVRLRNNSTGTDYYSTAVTDATSAFTHSAVPGDYSLYTGSAATVLGTPTLRNAHYAVPVTAGDDIVGGSATISSSGPYAANPLLAAGAIGYAGGAPHGLLYDISDTITKYDDFQRPDGLLGTALSGDVWTVSGLYAPAITSHKYTIAWNGGLGAGAAYAMLDNGVQPYQIGASYTFLPGSTVAPVALINTPDPTISLQNLVHFVHDTRSWSMQYRIGGAAIVTLRNQNFQVPLVADGATEYTTIITYDPAKNSVYLYLPDGTVALVTSPFFSGLFGSRCIWECLVAASTDQVAQFTRIWAVTRRIRPFGPSHASVGDLAKAIEGAPLLLQAIEIQGNPINATGGAAVGDNLHPTLVAQANNDSLYGLYVHPTFTDNGKTGVLHWGIYSATGPNYFGGDIQPAANINFAGAGAIQFGGTSALTIGSGGSATVVHDLRRSRQTPTETVLASGVDATAGELIGVTLTAARVVGAPLNPAIGQRVTFNLVQGGAGAFAVTWNAIFKGITGGTSGATGTRASFSYDYDGTNWNLNGAQPTWVA